MAEKSRERTANLEQIKDFLSGITVYSIDPETADLYGRLKAEILARFGPKEKTKRGKIKTEKLGFTENDLWIAAVAKRNGLTVVSADSDFERIKEVGGPAIEKWWSPDHA